MENIITYIKKNWDSIFIVVTIYTLFVIYLAVSETTIDFEPDLTYKKEIPILEGFTDVLKKEAKAHNIGICKNETDPEKIEKYCNKLSKTTCTVPDCCYYAKEKKGKGFKCVHATNTDIGPILNGDAYKYWLVGKNKRCYGDCPSK